MKEIWKKSILIIIGLLVIIGILGFAFKKKKEAEGYSSEGSIP